MPTAEALFSTVPQKNYLALFDRHHEVDYQKTVDFLELRTSDVANATKTPKNSIRYDQKIPKELAQRIREWAVLLELVAQYFDGDKGKTYLWFTTPNYLLGNVAPRDMIRFGRFNKLFKFVQNALADRVAA